MKIFGLLILMFALTVSASASGFAPGDLLVALTDGTVQVRSATDGTLKGTLVPPFQAEANGLTFDASGNLLVAYWWTADHSNGNTVGRFRPDGSYTGTFGSGYFCQPEGIVAAGNGNVYVGEAECDGNLLEFNSVGQMTHAFAPLIENGGVRWLDLAPNGCTVYYTSAGANVERYDVCTGTQLPNLNSSPLVDLTSGAALLGIRVTPDGGAMVSATFDVRRLDASGNPVGTPYKVVNDNGLSGVWLDRDGTSFWVASFETGTVYKFDIATHGVLLEFSTGVQAKGIVVVPPPATTPAQPPAPTPVPGRMTGGGTFAASDGTIVSDGFQLRCDVRDPGQNLEVNWGKGQKFHLDTVTTVTCIKDPAIKAADPGAPFDTMVLTGTGNLHGKDRATISLTFADAGQPGTNDGVQMVITDTDGNTVLNVPATTLISGDQQAHRATGK